MQARTLGFTLYTSWSLPTISYLCLNFVSFFSFFIFFLILPFFLILNIVPEQLIFLPGLLQSLCIARFPATPPLSPLHSSLYTAAKQSLKKCRSDHPPPLYHCPSKILVKIQNFEHGSSPSWLCPTAYPRALCCSVPQHTVDGFLQLNTTVFLLT